MVAYWEQGGPFVILNDFGREAPMLYSSRKGHCGYCEWHNGLMTSPGLALDLLAGLDRCIVAGFSSGIHGPCPHERPLEK
jgi:hypothetical protein